jgi:NAD(P)-dependent dehydrogenase (short-subunit alcohol dehydrogenase family)
MGKLDGKVAVITGGVSGIGKATARLFIEQGAHVVIADIEDDRGKQLVEELGANAIYLHTDVTQEPDVKAAIDLASEKFGRLDCMFNNAGIGGVLGPIEETPVEGFDMTIGVHLRGVFLGMKHAAPVMKRQGNGSIISTASVAGLRTGWAPHTYSAAKAAIIHLTRSVAMELGESGIRVNCICPGGIATPIFGRTFGLTLESAEEMAESLKTSFANLQPIKRAGLPEDIAQAALWLASDDSSFVNGHALVVDGGVIGGRMWADSLFSGRRPEPAPGPDTQASE